MAASTVKVEPRLTLNELKSLVNDNYSCIKCVKRSVHVSLSPCYIGTESKGVKSILDSWRNQNVKSFGGVLLDYENLSFEQDNGVIMIDQPYIHYNITGQFYIFQPVADAILKGKVNRLSPKHIGCVVHGSINVSLSLSSEDEYLSDSIVAIGTDVAFKIVSVDTSRKYIRINGSINDECRLMMQNDNQLRKSKGSKKVNGYTVSDSEEEADLEAALSRIQITETSPKKKKKKKSKKQSKDLEEIDEETLRELEESLIERLNPNSSSSELDLSSVGKKHKNKRRDSTEVDSSSSPTKKLKKSKRKDVELEKTPKKHKMAKDELNSLTPLKKSKLDLALQSDSSSTEKMKRKKHKKSKKSSI